jgi:arylsulfatase A-like enzyme
MYLIMALSVSLVGEKPALAERQRPNVLIIITDDQRADAFTREYMPHTFRMIVDQGILFQNGFVTTPLCAPSRASVLTGKYARNHGVRGNGMMLQQTTMVERLHRAGYYTGHVGKFLNAWDGSPRPEYDYWVAHPGGASPYYDPRLNVNGKWGRVAGYITYLFRDYALEFLNQAPPNQPFLLYFAPNAPHHPAEPAPEDKELYAGLPLHRPPSFNEPDASGKPTWLQNKPPLNNRQIAASDDFRLRQLRCLKPVDEAIAEILTLLERQGKLDDTLIFFMGDNGFFWGEHRLTGKNRVYEEAQQVPFALRYSRRVRRPRVERRFVANVDIAPTIYEVAGLPIPDDVDGRSLGGLLRGRREWRDAIFLEGYPPQAYQALRTHRYTYVETNKDRPELYDLEKDPYELNNVVNNPNYADVVKDLRDRLTNGKY